MAAPRCERLTRRELMMRTRLDAARRSVNRLNSVASICRKRQVVYSGDPRQIELMDFEHNLPPASAY